MILVDSAQLPILKTQLEGLEGTGSLENLQEIFSTRSLEKVTGNLEKVNEEVLRRLDTF